MSKPLSLSIKAPCTEKWSDFTPTAIGGYCESCCKNVVDFTRMTDKELLAFFKDKPTKICGRFQPHQLKTYSEPTLTPGPSGLKWAQAGFLTVSLLVTSREVSANTQQKGADLIAQFEADPIRESLPANPNPPHTITGVVKDKESGDPLPGVCIYLKGSSVGTLTDLDGRFTFPQELNEGEVLIFSFVGYEAREYVVSKQTPLILEMQMDLYLELMGEVSVNEPYSPAAYGRSHWWQRIKSIF